MMATRVTMFFPAYHDVLACDCLEFANILADWGIGICRYREVEGCVEVVIDGDIGGVIEDLQTTFPGADISFVDDSVTGNWNTFVVAENIDI